MLLEGAIHVYKSVWMPHRGEALTAKINNNNEHDLYAVAFVKGNRVVGGRDYPGIYLEQGICFYPMNEFIRPLFEIGVCSRRHLFEDIS